MRTRSLLILALITVAVLGYVQFFGGRQAGTFEREMSARQVLNFKVDNINRLELISDKGSFIFHKDGKNWQIQAPVKYPANSAAVAGLLSQLSFIERKATLDKNQLGDLSQYGLKTPGTVVKLKDQTGADYELDLGQNTAVAGAVYARIVSGRRESYAVIEQGVARLAQRSLDQWRSHRVFDFAVDEVTGVVLHEDARDIEIKRDGEWWKIVKPLAADADENEMRAFLAGLQSLQATQFVTDNPAEYTNYSLTTPYLTLDISLGGETVSLRVGKVEAGEEVKYYAQQTARPTVFAVPTSTVEFISRLLNVRDRRIVRVSGNESVTAIDYQKGALTVTLQADGENWRQTAPLPGAVNRAEVQLLLTKLDHALAINYHPATDEFRAASGLNTPAAQIILTVSGKPRLLKFSHPKKGEVFVESAFRDDIVSVPADTLIGLPAKPADWLSPSAGEK
ncbi:MAG: DUF4340 domain-containing protein [Verrucomicrobiales bacterium]|jgi:hypothetical protein|nr:DUF4340 domain-containing protein [Verrucomicrobiales bacterium]